MPIKCPYCNEEESSRVPLEDKLALIFPCGFSPIIKNGNDIYIQETLNSWKNEKGDYREWCEKGHLTAIGKTNPFTKSTSKENIFKKIRKDS